jgi:hypothetical protein
MYPDALGDLQDICFCAQEYPWKYQTSIIQKCFTEDGNRFLLSKIQMVDAALLNISTE